MSTACWGATSFPEWKLKPKLSRINPYNVNIPLHLNKLERLIISFREIMGSLLYIACLKTPNFP